MTGFVPARLSIFKLAFSHKSNYSNREPGQTNNERLEYLGDAVLGTIVAEYLFKKYPNADEGFLTKMRSKIVKRKSLNYIGDQMGLDVLLSEYNRMRLSSSMLGNAVEALVGAIYLEKGYRSTKLFVVQRMLRLYVDVHELETVDDNYKSQLLEACQKQGKAVTYKLVNKYKQDRRDRFTVGVLIGGDQVATADDFNKKAAEQLASLRALEKLGLIDQTSQQQAAESSAAKSDGRPKHKLKLKKKFSKSSELNESAPVVAKTQAPSSQQSRERPGNSSQAPSPTQEVKPQTRSSAPAPLQENQQRSQESPALRDSLKAEHHATQNLSKTERRQQDYAARKVAHAAKMAVVSGFVMDGFRDSKEQKPSSATRSTPAKAAEQPIAEVKPKTRKRSATKAKASAKSSYLDPIIADAAALMQVLASPQTSLLGLTPQNGQAKKARAVVRKAKNGSKVESSAPSQPEVQESPASNGSPGPKPQRTVRNKGIKSLEAATARRKSKAEKLSQEGVESKTSASKRKTQAAAKTSEPGSTGRRRLKSDPAA